MPCPEHWLVDSLSRVSVMNIGEDRYEPVSPGRYENQWDLLPE